MKRWNGWGLIDHDYPLPASAAEYLSAAVGPGEPAPDVELETVLRTIPAARGASHPLITTDPEERLRHARGQSLPDWVALRSGRIETFPDGVAFPENDEDVRTLLDHSKKSGARLIPYGGGSSVVGHINPLPDDQPVISLDMERISGLLELDELSHMATFGAGATGPALESALAERGYTLGHFPQSFELSTLGGWIATRSSGQQSHHYGRIEDLFAGGHLESPAGPLDLPPFPASAAGPDLREWVLGSEGRLGVLTRATVRIRPKPQRESFTGWFFHDWEQGAAAVRALAQSGLPFSMARLSGPQETRTTLALSGKDTLVRLAERGLRMLGYDHSRCLLILAMTFETNGDEQAGAVRALLRKHGGLPTGGTIGGMWRKSRFHSPYLRNSLWEAGYALDTLESVYPWAQVLPAAADLLAALRAGLESAWERVLAFAHISHVYDTGASVYVTYLFRRAADPDETLSRWSRLKTAASEIVQAHGGTISHQHGVGIDHAPYLKREKGPLGMQALRSALRTFDPDGIMNPGKLTIDDRAE